MVRPECIGKMAQMSILQKYDFDFLINARHNVRLNTIMQQLVFILASFFIYIGAFELSNKIFGSGDFSLFIGAVAVGVCFWGLVSIFSNKNRK
jgi:lipopolysaccharide export LptBFGC system permease protein LptF